MTEAEEPYDAHVRQAEAEFRSVGFTLAAMQYKRSPEALAALLEFNGAPAGFKPPFAWNYHPNAWCKRRWEETGRLV